MGSNPAAPTNSFSGRAERGQTAAANAALDRIFPPMNDYSGLLERMKIAQRELLVAAARAGQLPSDGALRKIADLEVAIGALEHLIDDGGLPAR